MRVQLALNVRNLDEAVAYYSRLFGASVNKRKPGYANFALDEPPLKLVLFENPEASERLNHLGVEVFADADVHAATDRVKAAGMEHPAVGSCRIGIGTGCTGCVEGASWATDCNCFVHQRR